MAKLASHSRPDRVGVLDLGSNTVLCVVLGGGGAVHCDEARITRLGEGVFEHGELDPGARERTRAAALELAQFARAKGAGRLVAVGTEALRRARDGQAYLAELAREAGIDRARILTPSEEARFAIESSRRALGSPLVVIDVGGGSTELAWLEGDLLRERSLPLGSVRLSEQFVRSHPTPPSELGPLSEHVASTCAALAGEAGLRLAAARSVVAVAGTATTLAALDLELEPYRPERVEGVRFDRPGLAGWIDRLAGLDLAERRALRGLEPGRADVIVTGLLILDGLLATLGASEFRVSGRGVRHGVALALLEGREAV